MLALRLFRAKLADEDTVRFQSLKAEFGKNLQPIILPALQAIAEVLRARPEDLSGPLPNRSDFDFTDREEVLNGEIFTDERLLLVLSLVEQPVKRRVLIHTRSN